MFVGHVEFMPHSVSVPVIQTKPKHAACVILVFHASHQLIVGGSQEALDLVLA